MATGGQFQTDQVAVTVEGNIDDCLYDRDTDAENVEIHGPSHDCGLLKQGVLWITTALLRSS